MRQIPSWDEYFMALISAVAARSKDPNTQVGAVIVSPENNILATGYNSLPRGVKDGREERLQRPEKYLWIEHAERNAIYAAARVGTPLKGGRIYIPGLPCMDCARGIIQAGLVEVVVDWARQQAWKSPKYAEDWARVEELLKEAGVKVRLYDAILHSGKQERDDVSRSGQGDGRGGRDSGAGEPKTGGEEEQRQGSGGEVGGGVEPAGGGNGTGGDSAGGGVGVGMDFSGRWRTRNGSRARVDGWDKKLEFWYGDLDGIGPQNWGVLGAHVLNPEWDLVELERPGKGYR